MPHTHRIRLVVADGHPLFRDAIGRTVHQDSGLELVAECDEGRAALAAIRRLGPDVAIVDAALPSLDGGDIIAAIVREALPTRVILLVSPGGPEIAFDAVAAGASGVLSKRVSADRLRAAIRRVAAGDAALCEDLQTLVSREIRVRHGHHDRPLTSRELEVLALIAQGMSARDIAAMLYLAPATVKTYTRQIYQRLDVHERAHAVAEAMRRGLIE